MQEMDWSVGGLMNALKEAGCDDNTLTLFTSDNGAPTNHVSSQDSRGSNAPLRGFKGAPTPCASFVYMCVCVCVVPWS